MNEPVPHRRQRHRQPRVHSPDRAVLGGLLVVVRIDGWPIRLMEVLLLPPNEHLSHALGAHVEAGSRIEQRCLQSQTGTRGDMKERHLRNVRTHRHFDPQPSQLGSTPDRCRYQHIFG